MWVKIEATRGLAETLLLPSSLRSAVGEDAFIEFGKRRVAVRPDYADGEPQAGGAFATPACVRMSEDLRDRLLLPDSQVYRLRAVPGGVKLGPVIGLLLGVHTNRYDPQHMRKYSDRMGIYDQVGGLIYAFSPRAVDWADQSAYGLYFNIGSGEWEYGRFPLPEVIYRRDFHSDPAVVRRLEAFTGGRLFNSHRFTKYDLYEYIRGNPRLRMFLPETEPITGIDQVVRFTERFRRVILKPVDLSRGRGICVVETVGSGYRITDYRTREPVACRLAGRAEFRRFLIQNPAFFRRYIIQRYLHLARVGGSCFDIRVVMQKNARREWACSGIECRVSGHGFQLTNISRGGAALTLPEALRGSFGSNAGVLSENILDFCRKFCDYMDEEGEHFAEFGMDVAVDIHKNLWLIEANVFPSFKGFLQIDRQTYLTIRYTPLLYALAISGFGEEADARPSSVPPAPNAEPAPAGNPTPEAGQEESGGTGRDLSGPEEDFPRGDKRIFHR